MYTGLCYTQLNNNLISQAATMTTNGLPNDVLSNLDPLALIIFIPICDLLVGARNTQSTSFPTLTCHLSDIPCARKEGLEIYGAQKSRVGLRHRHRVHDLGGRRPALHLQGEFASTVTF